jgi:hypothetical protein
MKRIFIPGSAAATSRGIANDPSAKLDPRGQEYQLEKIWTGCDPEVAKLQAKISQVAELTSDYVIAIFCLENITESSTTRLNPTKRLIARGFIPTQIEL